MQTEESWIEYGKTWSEFRREGLNKSGVQIDVKGSEKFLIGDINDLGGTTDEFSMLSEQDVVVRYRRLVLSWS